MRISLDDLEAIRDDPNAFREQVEAEEEKYVRPGRHFYMQNALLKWHKSKVSVDEARKEIIEKCERFKDEAELKRTIRKFDRYVEDYETLDTKTHLTRLRVKVPLPKGVDRRFEITGEVRRVDRNPDGTYTAWLFYKERADWQKMIHLPLFQNAVANRLNFELDEIEIGIYCFADGSKLRYRFSQGQIDAAQAELQKLLIELASLAEREPFSPQTEIEFEE
jgi:hypothetical protein